MAEDPDLDGGGGAPGACVPTTPGASCMVADSNVEFGEQQGGAGWWYGYWYAQIDPDGAYDGKTDFEEMVFDGSIWAPPLPDPDPWCYLARYWEHPDATPLKLPVRRWVSDVSGRAVLTVTHRKSDTTGGDGTRAILIVDGITLFTHDVLASDGIGVTEDVPLTLRVGSTVDSLLHPISSDSVDTTEYFLTIHWP